MMSMMTPLRLGLFALLVAIAQASIDREAVVARHALRLETGGHVDPVASAWDALTVGNGEFAFSVDLTGLQSFNNSFPGGNTYPLYTMSNWGWHTPDPSLMGRGVASPFFLSDGSLNYTNMEVPILSADGRTGKGNRTVPYQFDCSTYNAQTTCDFLMHFPARLNLGQLAFVLPGRSPSASPPTPPAPFAGGGPPAGDADQQPAGNFHFLDVRNVTHATQTLDPWRGEIASNWSYDTGAGSGSVSVLTVVDAETDTVSTRWTAPRSMDLAAQLAFCTITMKGGACEWNADRTFAPHVTRVIGNKSAADGRSGRLDLHRSLHADRYSVSCSWSFAGGATTDSMRVDRTAEHAFAFRIAPSGTESFSTDDGTNATATIELSCRYQSVCCVGTAPPQPDDALAQAVVPSFEVSRWRTNAMWKSFWSDGAFVDIAGRTDDARALELERRTILSAYLMRAQESGSVPPQESGLLYNSWTGKHHSEMRYWHQTWMPLWGHPELLARSDAWFVQRLEQARAHAASQGYAGARWGKMLGESNPRGLGAPTDPVNSLGLMYWESPNNINPGLVWHQPHVVYMAELEWRAAPNSSAKEEVLQRMRHVVLNTTAFIADFPERRIGTGTNGSYYDIGPPLVSAAEGEGPFDVWNPTYELTQFRFAIEIGQTWRARLGLSRDKAWDDVLHNLALPPIVHLADGRQVYNRHQNCLPNVFDPDAEHCRGTVSHPALTGALGCLPLSAGGIDQDVMNNTLHETLRAWSWDSAWGWDQPMISMTATRLLQPEVALAALLMNASTNTYLPTGYNHPRAGQISAYLPGNGGTLIAVALMAGGWDGAPAREAPGFPSDWGVQAEGFTPYF